MPKSSKGQELIGRAFRFNEDGIIRYVTGMSTRGYLHMLWMDEATATWFTGYPILFTEWMKISKTEVIPPVGNQLVCGVTGIVSERDITLGRYARP